jgi:flagellar protein FlgJ
VNPLAPLVADSRSLDGLRAEAGRDPASAARKAATQFEALFMRQVLKSMRDAMPRSGLWDGPAQAIYEDMLDQQMAQAVSGRRGGLAEVIARQLSGNVQGGLSPEAVRAGGPQRSAASASAVPPGRAAAAGAAGDGIQRALATLESRRTAPSAMPDLARLDGTQAGFVQRMWPHALLAEQTTGVPAAWIVGQAALESGWGRREIRSADGGTSHNLFGIKAGRGWNGQVAEATTTEYVDGRARRQVERFRAYGSYAEAFTDWARLMTGSARYGDVLRSAGDVRAFSSGMQKAGYATDPEYGAKLERTINRTLALGRLVL